MAWSGDRTRVGAALAAVAVLAMALLAVASRPALAHASGELPTAELHAAGRVVTIDLVAPPDDAAVIGTALGYLGEGAMLALLGGPADDLPTDEEVAALSASAALRDYLEEHVRVSQDGQACSGQATPSDDFLAEGARITFTCPSPVERAHVRITVLHDLDPAYRTFSVDGTEQYAIHTSAAPEHPWDFTRASAAGPDLALLVGAAVVVAGLLAAVVATVPRRRRERRR